MSPGGAEGGRHGRIASFWAERRARWTLPLVIMVIIILVATVDHIGAHRISEVDEPIVSDLAATPGGVATVTLDRPWDGFNPGTPGGADSSTPTLLANVLPSAFSVVPSLAPTLNAELLQSVEVTSTTPLTIQYVINPAAVWSDGVPVTAEDFAYAWRSQRGGALDVDHQPVQAASTLGYRDVASVTGSQDGRTVTVVFSTPFTDWRLLFSGMVPAHIAEKVGWNHGFDTFDPAVDLSAGPFVVTSAPSGGTAVLSRNPRWWGPKAVLRQVTVQVPAAPSTGAWIATLGASNRSVVQPSSFDLGTMEAISSLPNTESTVSPSLSFLQVEFDTTSPTTSPLAVRQAIARAIDRTSLLSDTFGSIDPGLTVSEDHLAVPSQPAYQASTASTEYDGADPAAVDRLLASVGFHRGTGGQYVDAAGSPLVVRMAVETGDPWITEVGADLAADLQAAGISVVTVPVDGAAGLSASNAAGGYDLALVTRTASTFQTTTIGWYTDDLGPNGSNGSANWSNFEDPDVDQQFAAASKDLNPVTGATVYGQIDDVLWAQMVALPLFAEPALVANGVQVSNVLANPSPSGLLWNLPMWSTLVPRPAHATG